MIIKFVTLPETCKPDKQSWADVAKLLRSKINTEFGDKVTFCHIEFMSADWFSDPTLNEISESMEMKFPFILINEDIFSNGEKVNIIKLLKKVKEGVSI